MSVSPISASESPSPPPQFLSSESSPSPPTPSQKRLKNGHRVSIAEEASPPETSLDNSGAVFWNASLLYYTGVASPKIKQHHLRNSLSMSDMHRPRSPAGSKSLTKSPSKDSGTGTYSSAATVNSSNGEERMSPLRRRHLSCGSSSTLSTNSSSMGSLKDRIKNSSGSMRVMKAISRRPSLSSFMEKTQSLGRYNRKKSGSPDGNADGEPEGGQTSSEATTSSSGLSSTAKVFRDSFRAARNMFEASSSSSSKQQQKSLAKAKKEVLPSSTSHSDTNGSASTINYSAPNTPKIVKSRSSSSVDISQTKGVVDKDSTGITASTGDITSAERFSKGATKESSNKSSITASSSSKTGSLEGSKESSKSISSKFKKSKDKDKEPEKVGTPKKVSLVKSITNKIRSRSKDSKEKDLAAELKVTSDRRSPPEIVQLENEPRVRTPKALRHRIKSPWQEKDREFNEMEVSEESLAISRAEKVPPEVTDETMSSSQNENAPITKSQNASQAQSQQQKSQDDPIPKKDKGKKGKSSKKDIKVTQSTSSSSSASTAVTANTPNATSAKPDPIDVVDSGSNSKKVKPPKDKNAKSKAIKSGEVLLDTKLDLDEDVIKAKTEEAIIVSSKSSEQQAPVETGEGSSRSRSREVNLVKQSEPDTNRIEAHATSSVVQDANKDVVQDNPNDDDDGAKEDLEEGEEPSCTESFRQLKPFNFDLEPIEEGKRERLYKVLVVGELGSGKTSIIKRYVHQFFSQHYRATIGVDFALKVLRWDPDTVVRLQLWDIAGQERFGSMTRVYYKEAVGAFVVFDVTRAATLEAVPKWKADLDSKVTLPDGRPIPTVLLANKSDQPKEGIAANREKMNEFCQQQGFSAWFETSAKDNINIDESANFLVSKILEMDRWSQEPLAPDPDKVDLSANGKHKPSSSSNCAC